MTDADLKALLASTKGDALFHWAQNLVAQRDDAIARIKARDTDIAAARASYADSLAALQAKADEEHSAVRDPLIAQIVDLTAKASEMQTAFEGLQKRLQEQVARTQAAENRCQAICDQYDVKGAEIRRLRALQADVAAKLGEMGQV